MRDMRDWNFLDGDRGRYIRRGEARKKSAETTPGYTPTTSTSHLPRPRPSLYEAAVNGHSNQLVAVKIVEEGNQDCLLREYQALNELTSLSSVPRVREFNYDQSFAFIALEYLGNDWISLDKDIQRNGPFKERPNGGVEFTLIRMTLEAEIGKIHRRGVVHGDLKTNHVFIKKVFQLHDTKADDYLLDYTEIKIIDFGASYLLGETSKWRGGSIGFSSPFHWNKEHREGLQFAELKAIDWYSANAILYHIYTGECFPVASPAFRLFIDRGEHKDVNEYYHQLEYSLHAKFGGEEILDDIIKTLCNPKDFVYPGKGPAKPIDLPLNFDYRSGFPLFIIFALFVGQIIRSSQTAVESFLGGTVFLLLFVLIGNDTLGLKKFSRHRRYKDLDRRLITLVTIFGIIVMSGLNFIFDFALFPIVMASTVLSIIVTVIFSSLTTKRSEPIVEGLLLAGSMAPVSVAYGLLGVLPIMAGAILRFSVARNNLARILIYGYISFILLFSRIVSQIIEIPATASLSHFVYTEESPIFLFNILLYICSAELGFRAASRYQKTGVRIVFVSQILVLSTIAVFCQLALSILFAGQ